jgi:excisionase family DNA binding protein
MPKSVRATETDLLTADQVIDRLLDANLRRAAATCVLPAVRSGEDWRFRRTDLEEWIRRQVSSGMLGPGGPLMDVSKTSDPRPS